MKKTIKTKSAEETIELGIKIGNLIKGHHVVFLLEGNLASGKTTFAKGIAKALGVNGVVNSPTFTILKTYQGDMQTLYHLDLYRLSEIGYDFDLEDYIESDGVVLIEWPNQVKSLLPEEYILIEIEKENLDERVFLFTATKRYQGIVDKI